MPHIVPKYFYLITVEFPMPDGGAEKAASSGVFEAMPGGKTRSQVYQAVYDRLATKARPDNCESDPVCTFFYCESEAMTGATH
jgi:hypothetical protein